MASKISKQTIFQSSLYTLSAGVFGKVLGFLSNLLIAYIFGANTKTDIIFFACLIIFTFSNILSVYNSNILLPQLIQSKNKKKLIHSSFTYLFIILFIILVTAYLFYEELFLNISQFHIQEIRASQTSILILLPILVFHPLNDMMINVAQAYKNYKLTNISSLIIGICNISSVLLFSKTIEENSLAIGFLTSSIIQFILFYSFLKKYNLNPKISFKIPDNHQKIFSLLLPTFLLQILASFLIILPDFFASSLESGTITLISYGKRIFDLIPTLFIYPLVLVLYPRICEWLKQPQSLCNKIYFINKLFHLILFPIALFFIIYSQEIIDLLFNKTKLNKEQLYISSECLKYLSFCTPAFIITSICGRVLAASQTKKAFYLQVLTQCIGVFILYYFIQWNIKEFSYHAILFSILFFQIVYSQITQLYLVKKYVIQISILKVYFDQINTLIIPIFITALSLYIKFEGFLFLSLLIFSLCNLLNYFLYYKNHKLKILKLLNS